MDLVGDELHIRYVKIEDATLWDKNPKRHDIPKMIESLEKHGFRDAPIYDGTANVIIAGNGRIETLRVMKQEGLRPPRGVAVHPESGEWYVPVQFGVDAESVSAAESFGVTHNNMTMMGGEFSAYDISFMWDREEYMDLLRDLEQQGDLPIGMSSEDLEYLSNLAGGDGIFTDGDGDGDTSWLDDGDGDGGGDGESQGNASFTIGPYRWIMDRDDYDAWLEGIFQDVGFDKESVTNELQRRLGIARATNT